MTDRNELPDLPYELRGAIQAYANRSARFDYVVETIRSYGLQCYRMGVEAERERCASMLLALKPNAIKLAAGEMTAQELRSVIAVLKWQAAAIRMATGSAPGETGEQAIGGSAVLPAGASPPLKQRIAIVTGATEPLGEPFNTILRENLDSLYDTGDDAATIRGTDTE